MPKYPYRSIGSFFDKVFRNALNDNFKDIETDIKDLDDRIDNIVLNNGEGIAEVIDARDGHDTLKDHIDAIQNEIDLNSEQIEILQGIAINIKTLGVVGDGATSDAVNFANAFSGLTAGAHVLIPYGTTVLIDQDTTISGISDLRITCFGKIKVLPYKNLTFLNCPNFKMFGNFSGNYIPSSVITALDSATKSITLLDASEFTVGDNVTSFRSNYYKNIAHVGKVLTKVGNVITVDVNGIIPSDSFNNLVIGQTVYETGKVGVVHFQQCDNARIDGYFETGIHFLNCNYPKIGEVYTKYAQVVFDFCYKPEVGVLNSTESNLYGLFFKGCRGQKTGRVNINRPYFSGLVMKSSWESDLGITHIMNAPIQSLQVVPNTIADAGIPSDTNPLLQNELYNRRNHLGKVYIEKANLGVVLTQETYDTTIDVLEAYDNYKNAIVTTSSSVTVDGLKIGSLIINAHNVAVPETFEQMSPFLIENIKNVTIDYLKVDNSMSDNVGRLSADYLKIGKMILNNCKGRLDITSSNYGRIDDFISNNQVSAYDVIAFGGNITNFKIKKAVINNAASNTTADRYIATAGTLTDVALEELYLTSGVNLTRGLYLAHSGEGFKVLRSIIKNATTGIVTLTGVITGLTIKECTITACGNPITLGSTLGDRVKITDNNFYGNTTSNNITDNSVGVANKDINGSKAFFNILDYGAHSTTEPGYSTFDSTVAIQAAINAATQNGTVGGCVLVPAGKFLVKKLTAYSNLVLRGLGGISYSELTTLGVSLLKFNGTDSDGCMIDCGSTFGVQIEGLTLYGNNIGTSVMGIKVTNGKHITIFNNKISKFKGPAIGGNTSGVNRIHNNIIGWNGHGIKFDFGVPDCWIAGNQINANLDMGIFLGSGSDMVNIVGNNRIEWNEGIGVRLDDVDTTEIIGNQFDRNKRAAIYATSCNAPKINSNRIKRNAPNEAVAADKANVVLDGCTAAIVTGNHFHKGANDDGTGTMAPDKGLVHRNCTDSIISLNFLKGTTTAGTLASELVESGNTNTIVVNNQLSAS